MCDCCNKYPWKYHGFRYGIETYWCWKCNGDESPEDEE